MYTDLRGWLQEVESIGELEVVKGADWNLEIGGLIELIQRSRPAGKVPALLFDEVSGYRPGYRICVNLFSSLKRLGITTGIRQTGSELEFIQAWREKWNSLSPIPPEVVDTGPVLENVHTGNDINMWEFPVPKWHKHDGGRYIGTANLTITRDPDEGWVNLGTYRVMVHDENKLAFYISPGKHGRIHRDKYFSRGEPCKVAISFGHDPLLFLMASNAFPFGQCEYDYAGAFKGEPVQVIKGPFTGLPIPAHAEIAIEGEAYPDERLPEGPFGEWTGYYASDTRPEPVIHVKTVMHRDNPIICGEPPMRPPTSDTLARGIMQAALIWDQMERAGVPDIRGVRVHEAARRFLIIVSIRQRYPGHSRQAALAAASCHAGAYMGRYVVVVDDDIDIWNTDEVIWAIATRSDPERSIDILRHCWSSPLDPIIEVERKGFSSRAIIDACRPWERRETFPKVVTVDEEVAKAVKAKWAGTLL